MNRRNAITAMAGVMVAAGLHGVKPEAVEDDPNTLFVIRLPDGAGKNAMESVANAMAMSGMKSRVIVVPFGYEVEIHRQISLDQFSHSTSQHEQLKISPTKKQQ